MRGEGGGRKVVEGKCDMKKFHMLLRRGGAGDAGGGRRIRREYRSRRTRRSGRRKMRDEKVFPPQFPQGGAVKGQAATDCKRDRSKSSKSHLSI